MYVYSSFEYQNRRMPGQDCLDVGRLPRATLSGTINYFHGVFSGRTFGGLSE